MWPLALRVPTLSSDQQGDSDTILARSDLDEIQSGNILFLGEAPGYVVQWRKPTGVPLGTPSYTVLKE